MQLHRIIAAALVVVLAAACASRAKPSETAESQAAGGSEPKASLESQREPFMQKCLAKVEAPDYCDCSFAQFLEVFKGSDPNDNVPPSDPRFERLGEKTKAVCASKLPDDLVKKSFIGGCKGDDARKSAYCECAWSALRKKLAVADFTTDFEGPRFDDAKKATAAACKGKLPADIAKGKFVEGCSKEATGKFCECAWKKLRAKYSTEEIALGVVDVGAAGVAACKSPQAPPQ
jgi:hypothetical protein